MTPEKIVAAIDFSYIDDALPPGEALAILQANAGTRMERTALLMEDCLPAYTAPVGWFGFSDEEIKPGAGGARKILAAHGGGLQH